MSVRPDVSAAESGGYTCKSCGRGAVYTNGGIVCLKCGRFEDICECDEVEQR